MNPTEAILRHIGDLLSHTIGHDWQYKQYHDVTPSMFQVCSRCGSVTAQPIREALLTPAPAVQSPRESPAAATRASTDRQPRASS